MRIQLMLALLIIPLAGFTACEPDDQEMSFVIFIQEAQRTLDAEVMTCGQIRDSLQDEALLFGTPRLDCDRCDAVTPGGRCPCECIVIEPPPVDPPPPPVPCCDPAFPDDCPVGYEICTE